MKLLTLTGFAVLLALPLAARADRLPLPADAPPAYKAECGSCHLAFAPALLPGNDWRRVMGKLDKHYGDNATLDDKTRQLIEDFLVKYGATRTRMAGAGDPPRLSGSPWFQREHRKVPETLWRDARVKSVANCAACHSRAEAGSYSESEISLPELAKRRARHGE